MRELEKPTGSGEEEQSDGGCAGEERGDKGRCDRTQMADKAAGKGCDQRISHEESAGWAEELEDPAGASEREDGKAAGTLSEIGEHDEESVHRSEREANS